MEGLKEPYFFCNPPFEKKLPSDDVLTLGHLQHGWSHGTQLCKGLLASHEDVFGKPVGQLRICAIILLHPALQILHTVLKQLHAPLRGAQIKMCCCLTRLEAVGAFVV